MPLSFLDDFGGTVSVPRLGPGVIDPLTLMVGELAHNADALANLCIAKAAKVGLA
jgi:hypothetical protein